MTIGALVTPKGPQHNVTSDFTTYRDDAGHDIKFPQSVWPFRCNETITRYAAVALVAATATAPPSVELLDVSDAFAALAFVGVALQAGVAGQVILVCTGGITLAKVDTGDPIFGDVAIKGASDGTLTTAGTLGGTWDGSDVANTALGVFLDVENASDIAPVRIVPQI